MFVAFLQTLTATVGSIKRKSFSSSWRKQAPPTEFKRKHMNKQNRKFLDLKNGNKQNYNTIAKVKLTNNNNKKRKHQHTINKSKPQDKTPITSQL